MPYYYYYSFIPFFRLHAEIDVDVTAAVPVRTSAFAKNGGIMRRQWVRLSPSLSLHTLLGKEETDATTSGSLESYLFAWLSPYLEPARKSVQMTNCVQQDNPFHHRFPCCKECTSHYVFVSGRQ
ncbi:hypothetical protein TSMEX_001424 [Taenia solium]|eukprot:TsM_000226900 transcript=TsM_000226900 gene=TsM_000226900